MRKNIYDGGMKYEQFRILVRSSDNVYCLQPLVEVNNNCVYNVARQDYEVYLNMIRAQWGRINLVSYYGYEYGSHTELKWYAITQMMIWHTAQPSDDVYFTDGLNGTRNDNKFASEMAEIEALISNHMKMPNLSLPKTMIFGNTISINDNNGVLSNFIVKQQKM